MKSQNNRPSTEIPHESRANSRVTARVCDVEGDPVCSKNFDGSACTPRLRFPTPIMAPVDTKKNTFAPLLLGQSKYSLHFAEVPVVVAKIPNRLRAVSLSLARRAKRARHEIHHACD